MDDAELLVLAVAEAKDFPELEAARAHLARLRLRVRATPPHRLLSFQCYVQIRVFKSCYLEVVPHILF